jgi:thymidylate synthase (FAD)
MVTQTNKVKLISVTPDAEKTMAYIARVSNPANQDNENYAKLLAYCIKHNHWSVFEQSSMSLEIETNRGIAAQILRHRSFTFQEFSQRYADTNLITENIPVPDLRRQDTKNRQNSTDDLGDYVKLKFQAEIAELFTHSNNLYKRLLEAGVAKECARFVLPLATPTRIYMTGSCRSWITYIALREKSGTQKEHMDIAKACKAVFAEQFPVCYEALGGEAEWDI